MMEAASTSETLVNFCQTTRRYNPEDSHLLGKRSLERPRRRCGIILRWSFGRWVVNMRKGYGNGSRSCPIAGGVEPSGLGMILLVMKLEITLCCCTVPVNSDVKYVALNGSQHVLDMVARESK
jgi:hypothetical protein